MGLAYASFDLWQVVDGTAQPFPLSDELRAELNTALESTCNEALAALVVPLDLTSLVASDRSAAGDPIVTVSSSDGGDADTLVIGVAVDGDDVSRTFFRTEYAPAPLVGRPWKVDIDAGVFTATVQQHFDDLDLAGEVDGWADTDRITVFWSGDEVPEPDYNQASVIAPITGQHPVWAIVEGDYTVLAAWGEWVPSVEMGSWAVVFVDLVVDDGLITAVPRLLSAGSGIVRIDVSNVDIDAVEVTSADFGSGLRVEAFAFDEDRLVVLGVDDHPGLPGAPIIVAPGLVDVTLSWQHVGSGMCTGFTTVGRLTDTGAVLSRPAFADNGNAPLWVCQTTIDDDPAGVFSVIGPDLPLRIDPGATARLDVAMAVADGDEAEYTADLQLRLNQMNQPTVTVPIVGHREARPVSDRPGNAMCLDRPELIPPQEWFDRVRLLLGDPRVLLDHQPDPTDVLVAVIIGLPSDSVVVATAASGLTDVAVASGGRHTLVVPATGAQLRLVGVGRDGPDQVSGAWLSTAAWAPVTDWSTNDSVVAYASSRALAAVLTPTRLTVISLTGRSTTEIPVGGGRDVVVSEERVIVLTDEELLLVHSGQLRSRAALRGCARLVTVRGGVLGLGDGLVAAADVTPHGLTVWTRAMSGRTRGLVPVPGGIAVVGGDRALLVERSGRDGLAAAREVPVATLDRRAHAWLEAGVPDPSRLATSRQIAIVPTGRRGTTLAGLGPSRLRLRRPPEDRPRRPDRLGADHTGPPPG